MIKKNKAVTPASAYGDALIQTRVTKAVADWVKGEAAAEGIPVAAFLRRLVLQAKATAEEA